MSKSTRRSSQRLSQLTLDGEGAWPDLLVNELSPQLNVFYGPPRAGKSSLAQLVGHLLFGRTESSWRRQFGQTVATAEGSVRLEGPQGDFVLHRHYDADRRSRLTISSSRGDSTGSKTIGHLLSGLSPQLASKVFMVDFAEKPRADLLLSETFAREFSNSQEESKSAFANHQFSCCVPAKSSVVDRVDSQRIDELARRRDAIAGEIQQQLSVRRTESELLEQEINELNTTLAGNRNRSEQLKSKLRAVEADLSELETRLRYFSLEGHVKHDPRLDDAAEYEQELAELDSEIARCRKSLSSSQQRENVLRTQLAQCGADGTADSVTCLADGRATLGVLEQLLDDLDAEVSQLARANEPGRCVGHESHAKLSPVAALLRQQVYTLCGQLTEQERIVRRQQLDAELRQLSRVHTELGERLDLLLSRRESLIQRGQLAGQSACLTAQPPAAEHCRCEHHGDFVQRSEVMVLGRADRGRQEAEARNQLSTLTGERNELLGQLDTLQQELQRLESRWEDLQNERAGLINGASIEEQQNELERLETVIRQLLTKANVPEATPQAGVWRASDLLAQLTNGQLVQIRLERSQLQATVVDRHGMSRNLESLSAGEHDQLYLALTLSLVSSYAQRGIHLPLVLDEPFLQQDAAHAATMVGVLDEFARAGHQILVFTEQREAKRRFDSLHATTFDLESLRSSSPAPAQPTPQPTPEPTPTVQTTSTRVVRETRDGHTTPALRLASVGLANVERTAEHEEVFYLAESSTFQDFPVLGADTGKLLGRLGIYSISDLLVSDATEIARRLDRKNIGAETVRLWQTHMVLMCHVPNLTLKDAQVLAANGIHSPEDLFDADFDVLMHSIETFLRSDLGRRFRDSAARYSRSRLLGWRDGARHYRDRWQHSKRRYSNWNLHPARSAPAKAENHRERRQRSARSARKSSRKRRFYLSREQDVEEAPSIGPKTATRLAKVGIRTVADLLEADPDSTAAELEVSHIKAETIVDWQHQSRLVCQIPELRGYGAQLLVGCGLTEPDQISRLSTESLVAKVLTFCETKEGQRILRSGDPPASEKIAQWVELATHSRPLEAA